MSAERMSRASARQMHEMLDFLDKHRFLAHGGRQPTAEGREKAKVLWRALARKLNSMGGAVKDVATWKKCWNDRRSQVRKTIRRQVLSTRESGDRPNYEDLSKIDRRILALLGEDTAIPTTEVTASPFPQIDKLMETISEPEQRENIRVKEPLSPTSTCNGSDIFADFQDNSPQHESDVLSENSEEAEPMVEHYIVQPELVEPASRSAENRATPKKPKHRRMLSEVRDQLTKIEERRVDAENRLARAVERLGTHPPSQALMRELLVTTEAQQATARAQAEATREQMESARQQSEAARQQAEAARQQAEAARLQAEVLRAMLEEIRCRKNK